uniref:Uncharacterized protein n=1 Tax=Oryza glaberrima TaxID=4538 RepID=I1NT35_ORYGL
MDCDGKSRLELGNGNRQRPDLGVSYVKRALAGNKRRSLIKTKGCWLRRWRCIPREQHKEGSTSSGGGGDGAADEDSVQLHKRWIPLPANAPRGKLHEVVLGEEEESSTASIESRFVPSTKLGPSLGVLIASLRFSVSVGGADSDNGENRSSNIQQVLTLRRALGGRRRCSGR